MSLGCCRQIHLEKLRREVEPRRNRRNRRNPNGIRRRDGTGRDGTGRDAAVQDATLEPRLAELAQDPGAKCKCCRFLSFSDVFRCFHVEHHLENVSTLHCINPYHLTNILCHEIRDPNDKGVSPWITTWSCTNFHIFWAAQETLAKMRKYAEAEKTKAGSAEAPNVLEAPHASLAIPPYTTNTFANGLQRF